MQHKDASETAVKCKGGNKEKKLACMAFGYLTHSESRRGLKVQNAPGWPCGGMENALSLLSIFISGRIDNNNKKSQKDKYAWGLKEVVGGRVRTPGFSQQAHSVHCMLIKHSSAGGLSHVWQLPAEEEFLIHALPHPGGCLVLVMAAVCFCSNWTRMFFDDPELVIFGVCVSPPSIFGCGCLLPLPRKTQCWLNGYHE